MLVVSRRIGEEVVIGKDICVRILSARRGRILIGLEAERSVPIRRGELRETNKVVLSDGQEKFRD